MYVTTQTFSLGSRHLPHRAQRGRRAFRAVTLRESQRQRPSPSMARLSSHQLRRYPVSRPSYRPSRSSSLWLRFWQGSLSCEPTSHLSTIEKRLQPMLTPEISRPTSPPNPPTTASLTPPVTQASSSSAKSNLANRCSNSKSAVLMLRSWPNSKDASLLGERVLPRPWVGRTRSASTRTWQA